MKRMLTTEQIKKVENNCGTYKDTEPLFVPFTKIAEYYSSDKRLEVEINIDFTDCLPGYSYKLDWYNTPYDKFLKILYPEAETWAEAVNLWRDIEEVQLYVSIYGLKSGIDFSMPLSLFAIEENELQVRSISLKTKDEDKEVICPIRYTYDEENDRGSWNVGIVGGHINPFWGGSARPRDHSLTFWLTTNGPVVRVIGGW